MYRKINFLIGSKFKKLFYLSWLLSFLSSIFEIISIVMISFYISFIFNFDNSSNLFESKYLSKVINFNDYEKVDLLIYFSIALSLFILLKNIYLVLVIFLENFIIYKIKLNNGAKLFDHYIKSQYSFFLKSNPSTLIRNLTGELDRSHYFILQYFTIIREVILTIFIFLLLSFSSFHITLMSLVIISLFVLVYYFSFEKILHKKGKIRQIVEEKLMTIIYNTFNSIKVIKIYKSEEIFKNNHHTKLRDHGISGLYPNIISKLPRYMLEVIIVLIMVTMILLLNRDNNSLNESLGLISIFAISGLRLMPAFSLIASSISSMKNLEPSFENFINELSLNKNLQDNLEFIPVNGKNNFEIPDKIQFIDVNFQYEGNEKFSLKNINFEIKKNSILGIIGESGSGKSTIVDILLGLLKPVSGQILFDDKKIDYKFLFNNKIFGYVPQNIYLNEVTIKENIAFGIEKEKIDEDKIKKLLKFVNLYDFVFNLDENIYTKVGYMGSNFSGGQVQRLGIARSLYFDPKFVILDEATNSLDPHNEQMLLKEIESMKSKVTFIVISHRDTTISVCDRIYRIKNGLIEEI